MAEYTHITYRISQKVHFKAILKCSNGNLRYFFTISMKRAIWWCFDHKKLKKGFDCFCLKLSLSENWFNFARKPILRRKLCKSNMYHRKQEPVAGLVPGARCKPIIYWFSNISHGKGVPCLWRYIICCLTVGGFWTGGQIVQQNFVFFKILWILN